MRTGSRRAAAREMNAFLARNVPITTAMGIRVRSFDAAGVTLTAPLKPNLNDKGIAFGGTLASILALSGWALCDRLLREAGLAADVLIAAGTTEYRAPVRGRIVARCALPPPEEREAFLGAYRLRGRARLKLEAAIETPEGTAAVFHGTYVARPSTSGARASRPRSSRRTR